MTVVWMEVRIVSERQRKFALLGGLFGLIYLFSGVLPDLLQGALLGLGVLFFVLALLPEKTTRKIRKWKRRGE